MHPLPEKINIVAPTYNFVPEYCMNKVSVKAKKVIEITNEPGFNKGVVSYLQSMDANGGYYTAPNAEKAMDISGPYELEYLGTIQNSFQRATVKIMLI